MKRLDSPLSITDWARLLLLLGTEHTTGPRNVLRLGLKDPERATRLAHRMHTLAAVRNAVTHRAAADTATLEAFRTLY